IKLFGDFGYSNGCAYNHYPYCPHTYNCDNEELGLALIREADRTTYARSERMKRSQSLYLGAHLAILALAGIDIPVRAQSAKPEATGGLAEVVVTARKREENIQDVPVAVTA